MWPFTKKQPKVILSANLTIDKCYPIIDGQWEFVRLEFNESPLIMDILKKHFVYPYKVEHGDLVTLNHPYYNETRSILNCRKVYINSILALDKTIEKPIYTQSQVNDIVSKLTNPNA